MKSSILVFTLIIVSSFSAYGQSSKTEYRGRTPGQSSPWFHITPVVGAYSGSFQKGITAEGLEEDNFQGEGEVTTGILVDYNSHRAGFALQTGLVLTKSNAVFKATQNNVSGATAYVDEYLSIPLAGKFYPFTSSARWLYFRFGANLSYLMSSQRATTLESTASLSTTSSSVSEEVDIKEQRSEFDIQALAGLGVMIPISKTVGVTVEANYYHGFINTDKTSGPAQQELYTTGTSGTLGLSFAL